jgi:signal transduction histidine kinase
VVQVVDDGPGPPARIAEGIGLSNVRARLAELHGGGARLTLGPAPGGGTLAEVVIPQ